MENSKETTRGQKRLVPATVIGIIILFLTFLTLYRSERTNNNAWLAQKAITIDPTKADDHKGMVKFSGMPAGQLVEDEISGKSFVLLTKTVYEYKKVKKTKSELVTRDGNTSSESITYFENDWDYINKSTEKAENLRIGEIIIRLDEAEILGSTDWKKKVYIPESGRTNPAIGDKKYMISGIHSENPIFAVGYLQNMQLESGDIFILSSYTEGKTINELYSDETDFFSGIHIRNFFCFIFLFIGLLIITPPLMYFLDTMKEYPVGKFLSKMGWGTYIPLHLILALVIVKFASVTVDLIWIIIACIIVVPAVSIYKRIKAS